MNLKIVPVDSVECPLSNHAFPDNIFENPDVSVAFLKKLPCLSTVERRAVPNLTSSFSLFSPGGGEESARVSF